MLFTWQTQITKKQSEPFKRSLTSVDAVRFTICTLFFEVSKIVACSSFLNHSWTPFCLNMSEYLVWRTCLNIAQCTIGIRLRFYILVLSVSGAVFFFFFRTILQFSYNFSLVVANSVCFFVCFTLFSND